MLAAGETAPGAALFGYVALVAALPGSEVEAAPHAGLLAGAYTLGTVALLAAPVRARVHGEALPDRARGGA